jgi:hypothetical protein
MLGPCVLIIVAAVLKLLVSLHERHAMLRHCIFIADEPMGSDQSLYDVASTHRVLG